MSKPLFHGRAFVSILMACGFAVVVLSGFALYVAPHGRGAHVNAWSFLSLGRGDWVRIHVVFSVLFPFAAAVHLWLNRKPFLSYLRRKMAVTQLDAETQIKTAQSRLRWKFFWLNRKPFMVCLRRMLAVVRLDIALSYLRPELLAALAVCAFLWAAAILDFPPGSTLLNLGRSFSRP